MEFNSALKNITPSASMSKGLSEVPVFANLAVGSPDIAPPKEIIELSKSFCENPNYAYTPSKGSAKALESLHKLIFHSNQNIHPTIDLSLCSGAKFGIYLTLKTLVNPNDHVMILQPYWLSYPDICISLCLHWTGFEYDFEQKSYNLELLKKSLLKHNSKVLLINNPNNPSGQILSKEILTK